MNTRTSTVKRGLALLFCLLLLMGCFAGCGEAAQAGSKTVTLTVVHKDGSSKDFSIKTDAETLREALEQEKLVAGEESEYGLFVKTVDGETVDDANEEWWSLTDKDGNMTPTGVDDTKIADGDAFTFTFTVGYDS